MAGLPHGFPDGSEPPRFARFQNRKQDWGSKMKRSATVADQVVLKRAVRSEQPVHVQQPWQIKWFSNLLVWICRLNWAFLFQRTAKSARSSCFCDPPGRFFDRALGSPQASIPALTAVWIHYSNVFVKQVNCLENSIPPATEIIKPGEGIESPKLSQHLDPGTYSIIATAQGYDAESHNAAGGTVAAQSTLVVK